MIVYFYMKKTKIKLNMMNLILKKIVNRWKIKRKKILEEELYVFKHSKPPLNLNPWKFSNHVIEEFSRPKADEIYGYREKKKVKYAYTVDPFRRPKDQGDLFDKHIGIL